MTLVLQIVVLLVVLVGLITVIMSIKNWHWAQMLLLLGIFFMSITVLFLGMEVFRIHRNIRKVIPQREQQLADVEAENDALRRGVRAGDAVSARIFQGDPFGGEVPYDEEAEGRMPGMQVWVNRLQALVRSRGHVWRGVQPGRIDAAANRIAVQIDSPKPHGLEKDSIVFAFEQGPPNPAAPEQGSQYLGEFRVVDVGEDGVTLESVQRLDSFTGNRLVRSAQNPDSRWSLYEIMPADSHELFAGMTAEELKNFIPAGSLEEYARHGTPVTADDDEYHRAGFDEGGQRVGPDDAAKAVKWLFDRPLRDYAYLFPELLRERVVMLADIAALKEDVAKLVAAQQSAEKLGAYRTAEKTALQEDLRHMERDRATIAKLLATVQGQLANARSQVDDLLRVNAQLAQSLIDKQLAALEAIDRRAPAPARRSFLSP